MRRPSPGSLEPHCFGLPQALLLATLALLLSSCSRDRVVEPDDTAPPETVEAEATIGTAGGSIEGDMLVLEVPPGAFGDNAGLRVVRSDVENPLGPENPSPVLRIEGIPVDYDAPLTVRLRRSGLIDGSSTIALGEEVLPHSGDGTQIAFRTLETVYPETTPWMELELPTLPDRAGRSFLRADPTFTIYLTERTSQYRLLSPGGHFLIDYGGNFLPPANVDLLAAALEAAYDTYLARGWDYSARQQWPVDVTVRPLPPGKDGYYYSAKRGDDYGYMEFSSRLLPNAAETRVTAGHEFFHLVQALYDPRPPREQAASGGPQYWLDEAASVHAEPLFSDDPNFVSKIRPGTVLMPFRGARLGLESDSPKNYGYGNAYLFDYVRGRWGTTARSVYERVRAGSAPFAAIDEATPEPLSEWWAGYIDQYVMGELAPDLQRAEVEGHRVSLFNIAGEGDTLTVHNERIPHLGTQIHLVRPAWSGLDESTSLRVDTSGGDCRIHIYKYQGNSPLERVAEGGSGLVVERLDELRDSSSRLLVVITNCAGSAPNYEGDDLVSVYLRVAKTLDLSRFETFWTYMRYHAFWETGTGETIEVAWQGLGFPGVEGVWNGNVFHAEWDSTGTNGVHDSGEVDVTVNPVDLQIVSWSASRRKDYATPGTYDTFRASGGGLADPRTSANHIDYYASGTETCGFVNSIRVQRYQEGTLDRKIEDTFICDADSYIDLRFYDEVP